MSRDYAAWCDRCRVWRYLGAEFADGSCVFGYSSKDPSGIRQAIARFVFDHVRHGAVQVGFVDAPEGCAVVPDDYRDEDP